MRRANGTGTKRNAKRPASVRIPKPKPRPKPPPAPPPARPPWLKEVTAPLEQVMVKLSELTEADAAEWSAWARAQNVLPLAQWQRMTKSDLVALDTVLTDIWRVLVGADGFHCLKQYLDIAVNPQRTLRGSNDSGAATVRGRHS